MVVAGRIVSIRSFGKLAFIKLRDQSGDVQLYLQRDDVADLDASRGVLGMKQLKLLDTGDFVEARGVMMTPSALYTATLTLCVPASKQR